MRGYAVCMLGLNNNETISGAELEIYTNLLLSEEKTFLKKDNGIFDRKKSVTCK